MKSHWSVRRSLAGLVLACLLPGIIGALILSSFQYQEGRNRLENDTLQTVRALVQAVDNQLLKAMVLGETLATDEFLARGDLNSFQRRAQEAQARTQIGTTVTLVDERAQQLVNLLGEPGEALPRCPNPDLIRQVFATGRPVISDVFIAPLAKRPAINVYVPVVLQGRAAYVIAIGILADEFSSILQTQALPPEWVGVILDSKGTVAARTHFPAQFVGQKGTAEFIERVRHSLEGAVESTTLEGIPVLSIYSRSPLTSWSVGIGIPRQLMEGELKRNLTMLAIGVAGLFVIGLSLAWYLGNRIARSVKAISAPAINQGMDESIPASQFHIKEAYEAALLMSDCTKALREVNLSLIGREKELMEAHRLAKFGTWYWDAKTDKILVSDSLREIYGRDVPPFAEQRGTLLTVESWERINAAAQESVRTGIGNDYEAQAFDSNGATIWINGRCEAVRAPDGKVVGLRGTVQDTTEVRKTQEHLRESQARFQALFEQAAVGIGSAVLDGRWLQVNDKLCSIMGYDRDELQRCRFQDITYPADLPADLALVERFMAGEMSSCSVEKRYIRKDGTLVWVNVTVSLVRTADGQPDYYIAVVEDIEGRKEAEAALDIARKNHLQTLERQVAERTAALQEARDHLEARVIERTEQVRRLAAEVTFAEERERQALARDLHDDLGQLLHVVKIKLGLLGRQQLNSKAKELIADTATLISDASRQVRFMTSQLSPPILSTLGLPAALRWLAGEIQENYHLSVSCRIDTIDCPLAPAQSAILFRAARELLINAARHSGSSQAFLELAQEDTTLKLTVEDEGNGSPVSEGTLLGSEGFGLASVRERIHFLGGTMRIETPAAGGVRVILRLSLAAEMTPAEDKSAAHVT